MGKGWRLVTASLSLACLLSCSASPEEQIIQVLDRRREGLEKKELALYMSTISPNYNDRGETYASLEQKIVGYFSTFEEIGMDIQNRTIYVDSDQARVVEQYILTFRLPGSKKMAKGEQLLILRKEQDDWKIIKGLGRQSR